MLRSLMYMFGFGKNPVSFTIRTDAQSLKSDRDKVKSDRDKAVGYLTRGKQKRKKNK